MTEVAAININFSFRVAFRVQDTTFSLTVQQRCGLTYQLTVLTFPVLTVLNVLFAKFLARYGTLKCIFSIRFHIVLSETMDVKC